MSDDVKREAKIAELVTSHSCGASLRDTLVRAYEAGLKAAAVRLPAGLVSYASTYEGMGAATEFVFLNGVRVVIPLYDPRARF